MSRRQIIESIITRLTIEIRMLPMGSPQRQELKHERYLLEQELERRHE